jgi:hypothetical protein
MNLFYMRETMPKKMKATAEDTAVQAVLLTLAPVYITLGTLTRHVQTYGLRDQYYLDELTLLLQEGLVQVRRTMVGETAMAHAQGVLPMEEALGVVQAHAALDLSPKD